jgi:UDP-N-acetylmuramoyl-L-alanyl-D-glutamate--2,6-diaminopimelate ligase
VTGTNGKTTTAYLIRDILEACGRKPGMLGTVEYSVAGRSIPAKRTTPDAVQLQDLLAQMVHAGCKSAVMEVSSHALDQKRPFTVGFDAAIFTNLSRDHLDYHVSMEKYFEAKRRLFTETGEPKDNSVAVINIDDEWGRRILETPVAQPRIIRFGIEQRADVMASHIKPGPEGTSFFVESPWGSVTLQTSLIGRFNVYNSLGALASMGACGIPLETIASSLASSTGAPGRLERVATDRGFHVFVDYAHSDAALDNVLQTLRPLTRKRLIVVFGCGGNRDRSKRPIMGEVATRLSDMTFITSDNPRKEDPDSIIQEICAGIRTGAHYETLSDRPSAVQAAINFAADGDIVLIAGKGHERVQELTNTIISMDDRDLVRRAL